MIEIERYWAVVTFGFVTVPVTRYFCTAQPLGPPSEEATRHHIFEAAHNFSRRGQRERFRARALVLSRPSCCTANPRLQTNAHSNLFSPYDIIALAPTTEGSFSLACLTHTLPSPLSAHVISVPLDVPRLPFRLKHTMIRTALRNGA